MVREGDGEGGRWQGREITDETRGIPPLVWYYSVTHHDVHTTQINPPSAPTSGSSYNYDKYQVDKYGVSLLEEQDICNYSSCIHFLH